MTRYAQIVKKGLVIHHQRPVVAGCVAILHDSITELPPAHWHVHGVSGGVFPVAHHASCNACSFD